MKLASSPSRSFLDYHAPAGPAEASAAEHSRHGLFRGGHIPGQDHTLAGGESVCLHDNGSAGLPQIGEGGIYIREAAVSGRWDPVTRQEVLGEDLGAFQASCRPAGSEAPQPGLLKGIDHAFDQRRLWPNDGEVDPVCGREGAERLGIFGGEVDVRHPRLGRRTSVARRHMDQLHHGRLGCLPGQGVLAPAASDHQYLHIVPPLAAGCAARVANVFLCRLVLSC